MALYEAVLSFFARRVRVDGSVRINVTFRCVSRALV